MLEDSRGYIWMGTQGGGLSRFDGKKFTASYTGRDGLTNNFVNCLAEDKKGLLWIGTKGGVSVYDGIRFKTFQLRADSVRLPVGAILHDSHGRVWFGTGRGVYMNDGIETICYSDEWKTLQGNISAIYEDKKGTVWIGNDQGLHKITEDQVLSYSKRAGLNNRRVRSISEDFTGTIWVGTYGGGLQYFNGKSFQDIPTKYGTTDPIVHQILIDSKNKIWVATLNEGVFCWNSNDSTFTNIKQEQGLSNNHVRTVLEDQWGNMWFGTSGGGANKYYSQPFENFNSSNSMPGDYMYSLETDQDGNIWMGIDEKGIARYDGNEFWLYGVDSGFIDAKVRAILSSYEGELWLGTDGHGVWRYDGKRFKPTEIGMSKNGVSDTWIKCITQGADSAIWIGTAGGGITRFKRDHTGEYKASYWMKNTSLLPHNKVNALHEDKQGRMWFGTLGGGIGFIENGRIEVINKNGGLPSNLIRSLTEDDFGYLWIGSEEGGLARLNLYGSGADIKVFSYDHGLTSTNIYLLYADGEDLWVGTEKGIDRAIINKDGEITAVEPFGKAEGFTGIEVTQNAVTKDLQGRMWFGTVRNGSRFDSRNNLKDHIPPIVSFTKIKLSYKPLQESKYHESLGSWNSLTGDLSLPYNQNRMGFEFIGINHKNAEKVMYQWILEGFDDDWSPMSSKEDATYSNIPPGDYVFKVKACNADLVWSEPLTASFTIRPPFWKTWWFIIASSALAIFIAIVILRIRDRRFREEASREAQRLQLEKDLVKLEQKALRLQMNPHFIFNALNSIQGLISNKDDKTARYYLAKFSKLMRLTLENSRVQSIPLENEIKTLENYLSLECFSSGEQFEFEISTSDDIDVEELLIPPMMIQPFVENAIIHGVSKIERKGKIDVSFELVGQKIVCSIADNGIGREAASKVKAQREQYHKSTALAVTQERLDILNAGSNGQKSLEIVDLYKEDGSAAGTKIVLRIPVLEG